MISSIFSIGVHNAVSGKKDNSSDDQIKALRSQESSIQKQIDSIKNGDMDVKTKQELMEPLQEQIQSIEAQIQQIQMSQISNEDNSKSKIKDQSSLNVSDVDGEDKLKLSKDTLILNVSNTYNQLKTINSIKKKLIGNSNVLKSDADFDENMENYSMAKRERAEAALNMGKANGIQSKIGKLYDNIEGSIKDVNGLNEKLKYIENGKNANDEVGGRKISLENDFTKKVNDIDEFV
ncbi:FlxA-like family protein [Clostridium sp. WLY-B-L2]|uniref:FlxA-like family protein n=1 Tax=Clostridium aromativorans TaxID=2836848 RepID=A0ABS8N7H5_9CLOT|nr:FlxA-like family protein [Clostridium aromativorans]MCC9295761.1 FlxA-like family protein [Clostridium aromativorans]CAB1246398.1 conserved hypothetical protein [Clostridiaceae bacterium BL-3]